MSFTLSKICKSYDKKSILKDISLTAQEGECIALMGVNGSGKSTLLSILSGVLAADSGEIFLDGRNLLKEKTLLSKNIGYVPQENPLIEELSAKDNLRLWYTKDELKTSLQEGMLSVLGINSFINKRVSKLSGGMKKRLSIGCAIAGKPKVLLLDEPTTALDILCKEAIYNYCRTFISQGGILIIATHEIQELDFCTKCLILKNGSLNEFKKEKTLQNLYEELSSSNEIIKEK